MLVGGLYQPGISDEAYAVRAALVDDVIDILQQEIDGLVDDGAAYIQIDSLHYVERIADHTIRARMISGR